MFWWQWVRVQSSASVPCVNPAHLSGIFSSSQGVNSATQGQETGPPLCDFVRIHIRTQVAVSTGDTAQDCPASWASFDASRLVVC